jgi:hypothetical protein
MAVFPTFTAEIYSEDPFVDEARFLTSSTMFGTEGQERRKRGFLYAKRDLNLKFNWITKDEARILWTFFVDRGGSYEDFKYVFPFSNIHTGEYVSIADGSSKTYRVPSYMATSYTLYVNGVEQTETTEYVFYANSGPDSEDQVTFVAAPDYGDVITWSFTGQLVIRCRFEDDSQDFESFYNRLAKMGIKLKGLLFSRIFGAAAPTTTTSTTTTTT